MKAKVDPIARMLASAALGERVLDLVIEAGLLKAGARRRPRIGRAAQARAAFKRGARSAGASPVGKKERRTRRSTSALEGLATRPGEES